MLLQADKLNIVCKVGAFFSNVLCSLNNYSGCLLFFFGFVLCFQPGCSGQEKISNLNLK